jgi:GTP-binding protein HflX
LVFNKIDALEAERRPLHLSDLFEVDGVSTPRVFVSARSGEGLPELRAQLAAVVRKAMPGQITPDYTKQFDDATP